MPKLKYKRILLKMSGEVFKGSLAAGIDYDVVVDLAKRVKKVRDMGVDIGIVIGGGNIWRYRDNKGKGKGYELNRVTSDTIGMMATNMNALAFEDVLNSVGCEAVALSAFPTPNAMKTYTVRRGRKALKKGKVVIFGGGTGSPFFTTDSAAAMRALEMRCDVLMKATKVDYVYDKDPVKHKNAKKFTKLKYDEVLDKKLGVMDMTCASICRQGMLPMLVFNLNKEGLIEKACKGFKVGTIINP
ncbi:UMP kinase [Candidatus Peregrinibacteria bacterium]|jgi:uridylate kinase|nr:UMP kinase [Candidatus Peregrinibacteria bacterium]MBT4148518.1 UMP kinase [Candidatus Peregrinibacteria bacterium]MBT4366701.1 UMP kinase [Candidatus Peregrinibacteria bacterium]MBT4455530.1 UMP kinase [Candidatus Peregrinibacteria bacterium]